MGLLEKYGRKKTGETRSKQIGAKIEKSLFENFSSHCDNLGLTVSDGIRFLIIEELTKDKTKEQQRYTVGNTKIIPIDNIDDITAETNKYIEGWKWLQESEKRFQEREEILKNITPDNNGRLPASNKGTTKVKPKVNKGTTKNKENPLDQWTIDKQIVCPECEIWMQRKSFHRHCRNKHGFSSAYDWMLLHKDKADDMVKEKQGESERKSRQVATKVRSNTNNF